MIQFGVGILTLSLLGSVIAIFQANLASQKQQQAQIGTELQRIGESAERQFNFEQINGLLSVMQTGQDLKKLVTSNEVLSHYPATSPLLSLQKILDHIQEHNILQGHQESVSSVAFSPNNQTLASASGDKIVRLWHLNGKLQKSLQGHQGAVYRVSFSPDGQTLATASQDETVKLWNLAGQELKTLRGHQGSVYAFTFSPDGRYLASSSRDKTARLWNREGQTLAVLKNHGRSVDDV
jgi:WD40 repeat protein